MGHTPSLQATGCAHWQRQGAWVGPGTGRAWRGAGEGGCRGAAGAGSGAYTCQTRAKEQTSFLVTLLFSPFWQRPLGARGS